jgi:lactoylglutathione lyase
MKVGKNINHISINVKNLDESIRFYRDILNFEQLKSVDMPHMDLDVTYFKLPGGDAMLELIHYNQNKEITTEVSDGGILRHIAFTVDDVDKVAEYLEGKGIELSMGPEDLDRLGIRVILIKDPNDVELEFCQLINVQ